MRFVFLAALIGSLAAISASRAEPLPITVQEAAECLGLTEKQLADVRAGKIVSTDFRELSERELAITVAMLVDRPIADVADAVRNTGLLESDPNILSFKALGDREPVESDFAGVSFAAEERSEVRDLLAAEPGSDFNLSISEIAKFEALHKKFPASCDAACAGAVVEEYRRALLARLRAYRAGGTDAIAAYARSGGKSVSPGHELETAAQGCDLMHERFGDVIDAFAAYPKPVLSGVTSRFFWAKQKVQDRPAYILMHRMLFERPDAFLGMERQFYVGHSYNSLLIMSGCMGIGGQTLVFYINRTSTDQVVGFPRDARHSLGRKHMRAEIIASLEKIRAKYEAGPK